MSMLHFCVLLVGAGVAALWANSIWELHERRALPLTQMHHEYLGALLLLAPASWRWGALVVWALGLWVMIDDAVQHERQLEAPWYLSPLHLWYARAYRWLFQWRWTAREMRWLHARGIL